ncbi:MAG: hypothetical protein FWE50_00365 [Alphaproteobacteria bacterium]|nr:hypothetical protein [Alphaproteobacteria bacterium]
MVKTITSYPITRLVKTIQGHSKKLAGDKSKVQAFKDMLGDTDFQISKKAVYAMEAQCNQLEMGLANTYSYLEKKMPEELHRYHFGVRVYDGM